MPLMACRMKYLLSCCLTMVVVAVRSQDTGKLYYRPAEENAVVDTNGVKWIDGRYLPLEGKYFNDVDDFYDRLPSNVSTNVNADLRRMKHHTSGMMFRFRTDSRTLVFRWTPYFPTLARPHMPSTGVSSIDVYRQLPDGRWFYVRTGRIVKETGAQLKIPWKPGEACIVNLPLYNGIKSFTLGIDKDARIEALGARKSGIDKPVVFYGTSITHGGCCTRPGMGFVNIIGRHLDVPVCCLGFSGSGRMELEMAEHLARIDASCYVLDCLWNMDKPRPGVSAAFNDMYAAGFDAKDPISVVRFRYEPFIRALRAKRPDVPIIMAEQSDVYCDGPNEKDKFIRALYERLVAEGWKNLVYLPKDGMYPGDGEGTVDGCHPNDFGMLTMADAFGKAIKQALGL